MDRRCRYMADVRLYQPVRLCPFNTASVMARVHAQLLRQRDGAAVHV